MFLNLLPLDLMGAQDQIGNRIGSNSEKPFNNELGVKMNCEQSRR
jgi:hypothetical protein